MELEPDDIKSGVNLDETPVLPELFSDGRPTITGSDSGVGDEINPPAKAEPDQSGEVIEPEVSQPKARPSRLQDRISKLVRKTHEKDEQNAALMAQVATLSNTVAALQGQLASASAPRAFPASQRQENFGIFSAEEDPSASGRATAPSGADLAQLIKATVKEVVAPLYEQQSRENQVREIINAHNDSMREAVEEYPELSDGTSELRKVFNELFNSTPELNPVKNKPMLVATMARGLLADARRVEQKEAARKRAASVITPTPAATDVSGADRASISSTAKKAIEDAKERMRGGTGDFKDYKLLRLAQSRAAAAAQKGN